MTIASPDGASSPATMLTAVTMPSIGAVSVASVIWVCRSSTVLVRVGDLRLGVVEADPRLADRGGGRRGVRAVRLGDRELDLGASSERVFASASWR